VNVLNLTHLTNNYTRNTVKSTHYEHRTSNDEHRKLYREDKGVSRAEKIKNFQSRHEIP
jgi:hypothetical protein